MLISASCADRLDRTFENIDELKKFNNSKRAAITELIIIARDDSRSQRFSISLNNDKQRNARISLEAEEAIAIKVNDGPTRQSRGDSPEAGCPSI
jgi:hypothetical protein